MALIKGFDLVGVRMGAQMMIQPDLYFEMNNELLKLAQQGKLKPHVSAEYPAHRGKEAFEQVAKRKAVGKICILFNESKSKL